MRLKDKERREPAKMDIKISSNLTDFFFIFSFYYFYWNSYNGTKVNDQIIMVFTCWSECFHALSYSKLVTFFAHNSTLWGAQIEVRIRTCVKVKSRFMTMGWNIVVIIITRGLKCSQRRKYLRSGDGPR